METVDVLVAVDIVMRQAYAVQAAGGAAGRVKRLILGDLRLRAYSEELQTWHESVDKEVRIYVRNGVVCCQRFLPGFGPGEVEVF